MAKSEKNFLIENSKSLLAFLLILSIPIHTLAAPEKDRTGKRLEDVKRALGSTKNKVRQLKKKVDEVERDLTLVRKDMVSAAKVIQAKERQADKLVKALSILEKENDVKLQNLASNKDQMVDVLVAVQRFSLYPPEALILQPMSPADTVRSAILLRSAVPAINKKVSRLRNDLEIVTNARIEIVKKQDRLKRVTKALKLKRKELAKLFGKKTAQKKRTLEKRRKENRKIKSLAKEASSLSELLEKLNKAGKRSYSRPTSLNQSLTSRKRIKEVFKSSRTAHGLPVDLTGKPISSQRGKLAMPVVGRIVGRFGQNLGSGMSRKGMKLQTTPGAQVIAPYEGRIVYAGKFRGYGELLITEHGEGYHSLLSGLYRIDSTMGQWVVSGEPVGVMGSADRRKPVLYVEFRRNGRPINPLPWLSARK